MMLAVAILTCLAVGCASRDRESDSMQNDSTPSKPSHNEQAIRGKWMLVWLQGENISITPGVTLHVADGDNAGIGGQGAVNAYGGSLAMDRLRHGEFRASEVFSTMMAGPPERMEIESRYFRMLEAARMWRIENQVLILANDAGDLARFERAPG